MAGERKIGLSQILSLLAGYVDTAGFLALQGLFTAHVTGNFVTLGAALVMGTGGALAKVLALPVFCAAVVLSRMLTFVLASRGLPVLRIMLLIQTGVLAVGAVLALKFAPVLRGDSPALIATGMTFICAMAIQNAAHRIYLPSAPPTTLMTGTTTQIMLDVAELVRGAPPQSRLEVVNRLRRLTVAVGAFAIGCGLAALAYGLIADACFLAAPLLGALALFSSGVRDEAQTSTSAAR
jgi:uncharacterized membrane protein YoaK (UPF0700 family)